MSGMLWQLSVRVAPEAEDALADLLVRLIGRPVSICQCIEKSQSTVSVYFDHAGDLAASTRAALRFELTRLRAAGLDIGPGRVSFRPLRRQDWAESWKRHFHPFTIGRKLLVRPSWSRRRAVRGQVVVILDPGLSFGTGQHPTTRFCLRQIVAAGKPGTSQSFLDIGTGSGILAIAAAKLGFHPVHGFDQDPAALRIASENAIRNRVQDVFKPWQEDLVASVTEVQGSYDLVCANLLADLLLDAKVRIIQQVGPAGRLVLAGILAREFAAVRRSFEKSGLQLIADTEDHEWRSGCFVRRA